jgi:hypothetical protein
MVSSRTHKEEPDIEPVSYTVPIGHHEYLLRKASAQARNDVSRIFSEIENAQGPIPAQSCRLVAFPLIPRLVLPRTDPKTWESREVRTVTPLTAHIEFVYTFADPLEVYGLTHLYVRRIRSYLAFSTGSEMPLIFEARTERTSWCIEYPRHDLQVSSARLDEVWWDVERKMLNCADLLRRLPIHDRLARAAGRAGSAVLADDPEDSLLYSWTALELLAWEVFGLRERSAEHPKDNVLVRGLLKKYHRSPGRKTVDAYYRLRNDVAHGHMTLEKFQDLVEVVSDLRALATEVCVDVLQERAFLPKTDRPFSTRQLVESWRGGAEQKIHRFTDVYPVTQADQLPSRRKGRPGTFRKRPFGFRNVREKKERVPRK